jgi:hypothetical protein
MDDMGNAGPNHPARRGLDTPNNVVNLPMSRRTKLRHKVNKIKGALFEPEQVSYEPPKPVEGALDNYLNDAQNTDEYKAILPRTEHFEIGQQEATIHSLKDQRIKRNMRAGDESVMRMINMDDPTKD